MLPYVWLQLGHVVASGALTALVWAWLASRGLPLRRRFFLAGFISAGVSAPLVLLAHRLRHWEGLPPNTVLAQWVYITVLWLPLLALAAMLRQRRVDRPLAGLIAILVIGGIDALFIEPNRLGVVERRLSFSQWPASAPPLRVVHISDLQTVGEGEREVRAARMINDLAPDLIVFCGDYIAGPLSHPEPAIAAARSFLGALRARDGIVCVAGHSETEDLRERIFAGLDLRYLCDEEIMFDLDADRHLRIFGASIHHPDLSALRRASPPGTVTVVVSHVPDLSRQLDGLGVDLHLAGHTHGGQLVIPGFGPPIILSDLPRKYAKGLHELGDHWINVTPGIGMEGNHAPRMRFFCPPEIHLLELCGGDDAERH